MFNIEGDPDGGSFGDPTPSGSALPLEKGSATRLYPQDATRAYRALDGSICFYCASCRRSALGKTSEGELLDRRCGCRWIPDYPENSGLFARFTLQTACRMLDRLSVAKAFIKANRSILKHLLRNLVGILLFYVVLAILRGCIPVRKPLWAGDGHLGVIKKNDREVERE